MKMTEDSFNVLRQALCTCGNLDRMGALFAAPAVRLAKNSKSMTWNSNKQPKLGSSNIHFNPLVWDMFLGLVERLLLDRRDENSVDSGFQHIRFHGVRWV